MEGKKTFGPKFPGYMYMARSEADAERVLAFCKWDASLTPDNPYEVTKGFNYYQIDVRPRAWACATNLLHILGSLDEGVAQDEHNVQFAISWKEDS